VQPDSRAALAPPMILPGLNNKQQKYECINQDHGRDPQRNYDCMKSSHEFTRRIDG